MTLLPWGKEGEEGGTALGSSTPPPPYNIGTRRCCACWVVTIPITLRLHCGECTDHTPTNANRGASYCREGSMAGTMSRCASLGACWARRRTREVLGQRLTSTISLLCSFMGGTALLSSSTISDRHCFRSTVACPRPQRQLCQVGLGVGYECRGRLDAWVLDACTPAKPLSTTQYTTLCSHERPSVGRARSKRCRSWFPCWRRAL